jgi:hypothetical protein
MQNAYSYPRGHTFSCDATPYSEGGKVTSVSKASRHRTTCQATAEGGSGAWGRWDVRVVAFLSPSTVGSTCGGTMSEAMTPCVLSHGKGEDALRRRSRARGMVWYVLLAWETHHVGGISVLV